MKFRPIYYISIACPTVEKSVSMIEKYIAHGATALQIDMPSKEPIYETEFVAKCMETALATYKGYSVYMDALKDIKEKYPSLELHLVVYPDVVERIGKSEFVAYCKNTGIASVMIAGGNKEVSDYLREEGLVVIGRMERMLDDMQLQQMSQEPTNKIYNFNYKKHREVCPHGCVTFAEKIAYARRAGVVCQIFAVEGIANEEMMREVKEAGADGALVGNVLMRLWDDEVALWDLFHTFESFSEK